MKKILYTTYFLLMSTIGINAMHNGEIKTTVSYRLNYPHCVNTLLQRLQQYGSQCDHGCLMIALDDPQFLPQLIEIGDEASPVVKNEMLQQMCILKCALCRKALERATEKLEL